MGKLDPNCTQTPDIIFDEWLPYLTGAETKIVCFVVRKTYGWKKSYDRLSLSQIQAGTGLDRTTVPPTTQELHRLGILKIGKPKAGVSCRPKPGEPTPPEACNAYALNFDDPDAVLSALIERHMKKRRSAHQGENPTSKHQGENPTSEVVGKSHQYESVPVGKSHQQTPGLLVGKSHPQKSSSYIQPSASATAQSPVSCSKKNKTLPPGGAARVSEGKGAAPETPSKARPTDDEALAYFTDLGCPDEAAPYLDHYRSNGWKVGKSPMKDWRAAARNWKRRREADLTPAKGHAHDNGHGNTHPGGSAGDGLATFGLPAGGGADHGGGPGGLAAHDAGGPPKPAHAGKAIVLGPPPG